MISFLSKFTQMFLKKYISYNIAILLELVTSYVFNLGILFYALLLKGLDNKSFEEESNVYALWMKIEIYTFYFYVFSSIVFLLLVYFLNYRGYWIKKK